MDAVEYLKATRRLCAIYHCDDGCPLFDSCDTETDDGYAQKVRTVEQWAKEHPVKTRRDEFFKQWPDAEIGYDGLPTVAPCQLNIELLQCDSQDDCEERGVCGKCRRDFWLKEIK